MLCQDGLEDEHDFQNGHPDELPKAKRNLKNGKDLVTMKNKCFIPTDLCPILMGCRTVRETIVISPLAFKA
jgi:hypothetical protein